MVWQVSVVANALVLVEKDADTVLVFVAETVVSAGTATCVEVTVPVAVVEVVGACGLTV